MRDIGRRCSAGCGSLCIVLSHQGRLGGPLAHGEIRIGSDPQSTELEEANVMSTPTVAQVAGNPDPSQLPGGQVLQQLTNGIMGWALILALVALVVSAVSWALGSNSNNYQYAVAGRRGVVVAGLAALLIGAAPAIINFFFDTGTAVR